MPRAGDESDNNLRIVLGEVAAAVDDQREPNAGAGGDERKRSEHGTTRAVEEADGGHGQGRNREDRVHSQ